MQPDISLLTLALHPDRFRCAQDSFLGSLWILDFEEGGVEGGGIFGSSWFEGPVDELLMLF